MFIESPDPIPICVLPSISHQMVLLSLLCQRVASQVRLVRATVFPVVTHGCESWNIKRAERRRIDAFVLFFFFCFFFFELMLLNCGVGEDP